ncbi:MAG TPA: hypothetical protein VM925_16560 [Labilithrix sp.]|nr:hypothetical protein [Labilithrix sp.]
MKKVVFSALVAVLAWPLAAHAQEAPAPAPAPAVAAPAPAPAAPVATTTTDSDPGPHKGYKGINVGLFPSGGLPTVGGAYFLKDDASLRLDLGLDINKPGSGRDVLWGFSVEGGYRMYLDKFGRFSPFIQPGLFFSKAAANGNFGRLMAIQANFGVGGEFFITNNFSVSAQTGLGLRLANELKEIRLATGTTGIFVNWYW